MLGRKPIAKVRSDKDTRGRLLGLLDQVILLAAVAAVLSLAYLLFVLMSGGLAAPLIAGSALEAVKRNVDIARLVFLWALWIALIAASVRHYRAEAGGYLILLAGGVCWFLLPLIVTSRVPDNSAAELVELAYAMVAGFQNSGAAMVVLGFLRVVTGRVVLISNAPRAGTVTRVPGFASALAELSAEPAFGRPSLMRRCWELHFCRGSLRVNCPRFLERVACWKARSGCYCDQGLATRLLDTVGARAKVQVAEDIQGVQRRARPAASAPGQSRARPRRRRARPPCGECPIYLDHQKFKYRVLSWLSYPAAAAVIGFLLGPLRDGYAWLDSYLGKLLAGKLAAVPYAQPIQEAQWVSAENLAIVLAGVVVAATIIQLTELAVFRLKL